MSRPQFDRVVLINLRRRADRLAVFDRRRQTDGWELPVPVVVPAVDGRLCGYPPAYTAGPGGWGCQRSHINVLENAITDGVASLLVFEDDAAWAAADWPRLAAFLAAVPEGWDQLMLGGQHQLAPHPVSPDVVRCRNTHRTHAYAIHKRAMPELLHIWYESNTHIDHVMGSWHETSGRHVYAPDRFIFGQAAGVSDISCNENPAKIWTPPPAGVPVAHLTGPEAAVTALRDRGLVHTGYDRDPVSGWDAGLADVVKKSGTARLVALRRWLEVLLTEAGATPGVVVACWHPKITPVELRVAASGRPVIQVDARSEDSVSQLLKPGTP